MCVCNVIIDTISPYLRLNNPLNGSTHNSPLLISLTIDAINNRLYATGSLQLIIRRLPSSSTNIINDINSPHIYNLKDPFISSSSSGPGGVSSMINNGYENDDNAIISSLAGNYSFWLNCIEPLNTPAITSGTYGKIITHYSPSINYMLHVLDSTTQLYS